MVSHSKLIRIKLSIKDISGIVSKDTKKYLEEISIQVNKTKKLNYKINNYEIGTSFLYTHEVCNYNECYIKEDIANSSVGRRILYMKVSSDDTAHTVLENFIKYGKFRYVVNGKSYEERVKTTVTKKYRGNYLYFDVSDVISNASSIELVLTIRNNQYIYKLK